MTKLFEISMLQKAKISQKFYKRKLIMKEFSMLDIKTLIKAQ